ncbi:MAG: hypothetical protein M1834_006474 [Cirrosporium novae-zelandiae]|nr:MAG: hypothetical protein M1834_006474 [Cirrosporium novae-zelandiae]
MASQFDDSYIEVDPLTPQQEDPSPKPILHIEARLRQGHHILQLERIAESVAKWLLTEFNNLMIGQEVLGWELLDEAQSLESIRAVDISGVSRCDPPIYELSEVDIEVQAFQLNPSRPEDLHKDHSQDEEHNSGTDIPQARVMELPSQDLDKIWDSLIYDTPIPNLLLRFVTRMMKLSSRISDIRPLAWNRLILLYGSPGCGKTSLCRALAQKLSIRLSKQYSQSKLIEINSHSLFSKYFSESGKLVSKMFEGIESLLDEDEDVFVCVVIDEVESLAITRENAVRGNEPNDALRAVNALLTALDRLRTRKNVVVLCTSNLITAMDSAFLDRADLKELIPNPSPKTCYEIFRRCLLDLASCGIISPDNNGDGLPDFYEMRLQTACDDTTSVPAMLAKVATKSEVSLKLPRPAPSPSLHTNLNLYSHLPNQTKQTLNPPTYTTQALSARTLRRLPALGIAMYSDKETCDLSEAIDALSKAVDKETEAMQTARKSKMTF